MIIYLSIILGKIISSISRIADLGSGSTWPGYIVLKFSPGFLKRIIKKNYKLKVVLVAGTNGKTTTTSMITKILKDSGKTVFQNTSGANLKSGLVSSFTAHATLTGKIKYEYAVLEVDENNLSIILKDITPYSIVVLNLFRDQLDRYEEIDNIAIKWNFSFQDLTFQTKLILNADDPLIVNLSQNTKANVCFFGLNDKTENKTHQHASDSIYCPRCKTKLTYTQIYYSHLGHWHCPSCKFTRPIPNLTNISCPLPGTYNKYNALAAGLFLLGENISQNNIEKSMGNIIAVFGRQEKVKYNGKNVQIFLSKNPTSFNQTLDAIFSNPIPKKSSLMIVLNDDIPDGRDVSWIWDIDFEEYINFFSNIVISGYRAYDMALRLQYAQKKYQALSTNYHVELNLKKAINEGLKKTPPDETLYILPTYSAMLEVRKILTGKKIF
jgi:UDP-N-acetylmuramyl tripeptide synthase